MTRWSVVLSLLEPPHLVRFRAGSPGPILLLVYSLGSLVTSHTSIEFPGLPMPVCTPLHCDGGSNVPLLAAYTIISGNPHISFLTIHVLLGAKLRGPCSPQNPHLPKVLLSSLSMHTNVEQVFSQGKGKSPYTLPVFPVFTSQAPFFEFLSFWRGGGGGGRGLQTWQCSELDHS